MIRKAKLSDAKDIQDLVNFFASRGDMLPRSLNEIYENIRDFYVLEVDGKVNGCVALHSTWEDLLEVKALAVNEAMQKKGWGKALVDAALAEAREMGARRVFALTYLPEFFKKYGFQRIGRNRLPQKIWGECLNCLKFPDCDETAVILELNGKEKA